MLKTIWNFFVAVFDLLWQGILFVWLALNAVGEWSHHVIHSSLKANPFIGQLSLFVGSLLFSPFPWWTAFIFMLIPLPIAIPILVVFFIMFIVSFATNLVFV